MISEFIRRDNQWTFQDCSKILLNRHERTVIRLPGMAVMKGAGSPCGGYLYDHRLLRVPSPLLFLQSSGTRYRPGPRAPRVGIVLVLPCSSVA